MNMTYYKEEELLKVTETTDAWGIKEKSVTWEEHDIKRVDDYYLGLCTNCLYFFLRWQKHSGISNGTLMQITNTDSSVVKNNAEQYNREAPKVAYGIVAWLLRYTYYDEELGCLSAKESLDTISNRYREECYKRWQYQHQKKYHHYSVVEQNEAEIEELDKLFLSQHIEQEREYINTFSRLTFIVEAHYKALMARCNEYLNYSTIKQQQSAPQAKEKNLECLFPTLPNWNFSKMLDELRQLMYRKRSIIEDSLTLDGFVKHIKSADVSFIQGEKVKGYRIAFIRQAGITLGNLWRTEAIRKAKLSQKDIESYPLTDNQTLVVRIILRNS